MRAHPNSLAESMECAEKSSRRKKWKCRGEERRTTISCQSEACECANRRRGKQKGHGNHKRQLSNAHTLHHVSNELPEFVSGALQCTVQCRISRHLLSRIAHVWRSGTIVSAHLQFEWAHCECVQHWLLLSFSQREIRQIHVHTHSTRTGRAIAVTSSMSGGNSIGWIERFRFSDESTCGWTNGGFGPKCSHALVPVDRSNHRRTWATPQSSLLSCLTWSVNRAEISRIWESYRSGTAEIVHHIRRIRSQIIKTERTHQFRQHDRRRTQPIPRRPHWRRKENASVLLSATFIGGSHRNGHFAGSIAIHAGNG